MELPESVTTCLITFHAISVKPDAEDPDREPDASPIENARVTLQASVQRVITASEDPTLTIVLEKYEGTTNADGVLVGSDGEEGIRVIATDNPLLNPVNFTYSVTISGVGSSYSFNIAAPSNGELDLSTVTPIKASGGVGVTPISVGMPVLAPEGYVVTSDGEAWVGLPPVSGVPDPALLPDGSTLITSGGAWIVISPEPPPEDPYGDLIISHTPFRYWKLDDESGDMLDFTGNSDPMPIQGYGSETDQDPIAPFTSRSVHMDASWLYSDPISVDETDMTFECWFNRDVGGSADGFHQLFGVDMSVAGAYLFLDISKSTDPDSFRMYGNGSAATDVPIPADDAPHHMVVTVSRSTGQLKLYIDTVLVMTTFGYPSYTYNDTPIMIGNGNNPASAVHAFKGLMSDFAIYQRALTLTEIGQHYEMGTEGP